MQIRVRTVKLLCKTLDSIQRVLAFNAFKNCAHRLIVCSPIAALRITWVKGVPRRTTANSAGQGVIEATFGAVMCSGAFTRE